MLMAHGRAVSLTSTSWPFAERLSWVALSARKNQTTAAAFTCFFEVTGGGCLLGNEDRIGDPLARHGATGAERDHAGRWRRIEFCCVVEQHRWAGSNSMYHHFFGSRAVQIELAAYEPDRWQAQLPNHTSPRVGEEWQPQEAQPDDAPLPAMLGRTEVVTLHRHHRGFASDDEVAVLHTADEKQ